MNILRFLSYFAKILSVNRVKSSISQNLFLKMYSSSMAFETEYISRPNLGTSADVPDVPSHTSMAQAIDVATNFPIKSSGSIKTNREQQLNQVLMR